MPKRTYLFFLIVFLTSCSGLEKQAIQLEVGDSRSEVAKIMGPAPYKFTHENVDAWRYAVIGGFGYCDYREFYIYRDILIYKNEYHHASIAGCTAGLKNITWEPIISVAEDYDSTHPISSDNPNQPNIVDQLKELSQMKESGALTEEEYSEAKKSLLNE